jgi:hypothetical protein
VTAVGGRGGLGSDDRCCPRRTRDDPGRCACASVLVVRLCVGNVQDQLVVVDRRRERQDDDGRRLAVLDDRFVGRGDTAEQHRVEHVRIAGRALDQRRPVS